MNSIGKIDRLNKIPQLLNKKREAQKEREKSKQKEEAESEEDRYVPLEYDESAKKKPPVTALVKVTTPKVEQKRSAKEGVGSYIDLTI